jgi:hypothetical protein
MECKLHHGFPLLYFHDDAGNETTFRRYFTAFPIRKLRGFRWRRDIECSKREGYEQSAVCCECCRFAERVRCMWVRAAAAEIAG